MGGALTRLSPGDGAAAVALHAATESMTRRTGSKAYSATAGRPGSGVEEVDGGLLAMLLPPPPPPLACPRAMAATSRRVAASARASPRWARMRVQGGRRAANAAEASALADVSPSSSDDGGGDAGADQEDAASSSSMVGASPGGGGAPVPGGARSTVSGAPIYFFFVVARLWERKKASRGASFCGFLLSPSTVSCFAFLTRCVCVCSLSDPLRAPNTHPDASFHHTEWHERHGSAKRARFGGTHA